MHPDLKNRFLTLEEKKNFYVKFIGNHSVEQLNYSQGEEWNLAEVMDHVIKVEAQTLHFVKGFDFSRKDEKLGIIAAINSLLLKIALKSPLKFKVPTKVVIPETKSREVLLAEWKKLRKEMEAFLNSFPASKMHNFIFFHPRSGKLNISQTLAFLIAHMDHHNLQLKKISNYKDFPTATEI